MTKIVQLITLDSFKKNIDKVIKNVVEGKESYKIMVNKKPVALLSPLEDIEVRIEIEDTAENKLIKKFLD